MVKKIDGNKRPGSVGSTPTVESGKPVGVGGVGGVGKVGAVTQKGGADSVGRLGRKMTIHDKKHLMALVEDEAEKLFGEGKLPKHKKQVIEGAVKMALDAAIMDEEEEEK